MDVHMNWRDGDIFFDRLSKIYQIYAPKRFKNEGRYSDTDVIRYAEVNNIREIVWQAKSDYPAKEVLTPIQQAIFYFTEDEYRESRVSEKPILIFARPCDIAAQKIQEKIYLTNGEYEDLYYKRMLDRVKFVMMECNGGDDTCFCVSMGTNRTDNYAAAFRFQEDEIFVHVVDSELNKYLDDMEQTEYEPIFVEKNELEVKIPDLSDPHVCKELKKHRMWDEYNARCISCGSCTIACSTCTCFTTRDLYYGDNPEVGERRRVSASCQIAGFDQMAQQRESRDTAAARMRYKMMHKFHDYKARFGDSHMCVGCGRCTGRCPEFISISSTLNKMCHAVAEIKESFEQGGEQG